MYHKFNNAQQHFTEEKDKSTKEIGVPVPRKTSQIKSHERNDQSEEKQKTSKKMVKQEVKIKGLKPQRTFASKTLWFK